MHFVVYLQSESANLYGNTATKLLNANDNIRNTSSSINVVEADMYLLLHHRQPLACRFCHGVPHGLYAIHYH